MQNLRLQRVCSPMTLRSYYGLPVTCIQRNGHEDFQRNNTITLFPSFSLAYVFFKCLWHLPLTSERPVALMATDAIIWKNCLPIFINTTHKYHVQHIFALFISFHLYSKNISAYICWFSCGTKSQYEITGISFCGHFFVFKYLFMLTSCWTKQKNNLCILQSQSLISTLKKNLVGIHPIKGTLMTSII